MKGMTESMMGSTADRQESYETGHNSVLETVGQPAVFFDS